MNEVKLNIGAGKTKKEGFISVDAFNEKADILAPAHNTGFGENSIDEIYSSHMLEHIDRSMVDETISHWKKILKINGKITILVPNAELYLKEWIEAVECNNWKHLENWGTRWIMGFEGKGVGMYHTNLYHPQTLIMLMNRHGLKVKRCETCETRVKAKHHFEHRNNGDIICVAIKCDSN